MVGEHECSGVLAEYLRSDDAKVSPECHADLVLIDRVKPRRRVESYRLLHAIIAGDEAKLDAIQAALDADPADVRNAK